MLNDTTSLTGANADERRTSSRVFRYTTDATSRSMTGFELTFPLSISTVLRPDVKNVRRDRSRGETGEPGKLFQKSRAEREADAMLTYIGKEKSSKRN